MMTPLIFLGIVLLVGVLLLAVVSGGAKRSSGSRRGGRSNGGPRMNRAQVVERWSTIEAMAAGGGNGLRTAVSEADKLFDLALRQSGARGETMGERLKTAKPQFSSYSIYDAVWRAHKLRNALAHEVGFDLVASQAREALSDFQRGLRDLGAL